MAQLGGFLHNINIWRHFGQNLCFWPPGVPIYRVPLNCYAVDYEDIAIRFTLNVFFVYFVLSNGPNWEDFCIISIFGVIFGQNLGFWPPGVPIYRVPLNCYAVDYEDIASRFNLNVFLVTICILMAQTGRILTFLSFLTFFDLKNAFFGPHLA